MTKYWLWVWKGFH